MLNVWRKKLKSVLVWVLNVFVCVVVELLVATLTVLVGRMYFVCLCRKFGAFDGWRDIVIIIRYFFVFVEFDLIKSVWRFKNLDLGFSLLLTAYVVFWSIWTKNTREKKEAYIFTDGEIIKLQLIIILT